MSKSILIMLLLLCQSSSFFQETGKTKQEIADQPRSESPCLMLEDINSQQLELAKHFDDHPETNPEIGDSNNRTDYYRQRFRAYLFTGQAGEASPDKLRDDVIKYRVCYTVRGHYRSGTDVYYLPKQKVFFLTGDCVMNHGDGMVGPFAGDPRKILPEVAVPGKR